MHMKNKRQLIMQIYHDTRTMCKGLARFCQNFGWRWGRRAVQKAGMTFFYADSCDIIEKEIRRIQGGVDSR